MKVFIIGCGQCGNRIADEFVFLAHNIKKQRRLKEEIVTGALVVNTAQVDIYAVKNIPKDHQILLTDKRGKACGAGKINQRGAQLAHDKFNLVTEAINKIKTFHGKTDAILVIGATSGGTGSGSVPVIVDKMKKNYGKDMPVYALLVLPFEYQEKNEERAGYNTATCLKATYEKADAVFLVDNQTYIQRDASLSGNLAGINYEIIFPFMDLFYAGEQKKPKYINQVVDASDIIASLDGWTIMGSGQSNISFWDRHKRKDFTEESEVISYAIAATEKALSELSLYSKYSSLEEIGQETGRILFLLRAAEKDTYANILSDIEERLKMFSPEADIRGGYYPVSGRGVVNVTIILSQLPRLKRVEKFYLGSDDYLEREEQKKIEREKKISGLKAKGGNVPNLFDSLKEE